eukprot:74059-Alexandrium_andersonii.AAC.1
MGPAPPSPAARAPLTPPGPPPPSSSASAPLTPPRAPLGPPLALRWPPPEPLVVCVRCQGRTDRGPKQT